MSVQFHRKIVRAINKPIRARRMRAFVEALKPWERASILDIGGTHNIWKERQRWRIVLLNMREPEEKRLGYKYVTGDAKDLQFCENSFDIAFSNSVIEHVGTIDDQKQFAHEMRRVGKSVWCQTPARHFPIDTHFIAPFFHFLPKSWQKKLARYGTLWGLLCQPTQEQINQRVDEIRLLTYPEMQALFPDCEIRKERFLGLTKSYIAVRPQNST